MKITKLEILNILKEDKAFDDITSNSVIVQNIMHDFNIISKNKTPFVLCGIEAIPQALSAVLAKYTIDFSAQDGEIINPNETIIRGRASIKELLQVERTMLNIIQHLSGISTKTYAFIKELDNNKIKILDTRKTIPYLRSLQKYAVSVGGGENHRMNLAEMAMIKDNHIVASNGDISKAVRLVKKYHPNIRIEVECDTVSQVKDAIQCTIDVIMLDNMPIEEILIASEIIRKTPIKIEVSGGINFKNLHLYRNLDIDYISIGELTHSVKAVDISLEIIH